MRPPGRFLCAAAKDQRHPVAGWQPNELFVRRFPHRRRRQHDFNELVEPLLLLFVQELRVTDNVNEQDMSDRQMETVVGFRRHEPFLTRGPPSADLF